MTGPFNSVIGMKKKTSINRFVLGTPQRFHVADKDNRLCGVIASIDTETAKCVEIDPIIFPEFQNSIT